MCSHGCGGEGGVDSAGGSGDGREVGLQGVEVGVEVVEEGTWGVVCADVAGDGGGEGVGAGAAFEGVVVAEGEGKGVAAVGECLDGVVGAGDVVLGGLHGAACRVDEPCDLRADLC